MATGTSKPRASKPEPHAAGTGGDGVDSDAAPEPAASTERNGLSRAVIWTGIALGTAVAGLAISDGAVPRLPGLAAWLGIFLGVVIAWVLIVLAAITLTELTRRHHKTAAKAAVSGGRRGALATGRTARRHGRALAARAAVWAGARWQARQERRARRVCAACGNPEGGKYGPLVRHREDGETWLIHQAHFEDPATGYHGLPYTPAPGPDGQDSQPQPTGGNPQMSRTSTETPICICGRPAANNWCTECRWPYPECKCAPLSDKRPDSPGGGTPSRARGPLPAEWAGVAARAADFVPGDDAELLEWMGQEVTGISGWAEALIETYSTLAEGIGVDPAALTLLHDVADAAAQCAETMGAAGKKFADHYERPRDFAADGGKFPHYGPWITGEGEA